MRRSASGGRLASAKNRTAKGSSAGPNGARKTGPQMTGFMGRPRIFEKLPYHDFIGLSMA
jgi:hypothetical protein